jgi:Tol biopolymer transport system component
MTRTLAVLAAVVVAATADGGPASSAPAATGGRIAVATTDGRIALLDEAGRYVAVLTRKPTATTMDGQPAWSPDGRRLAFARSADGGRSFGVYVMRADGSGLRRISHTRFAASPSWSPDGRWIAFVSESGLRVVRPDGTGTRSVDGTGRQVPNCTESYADYPSWTPRGRLSFSFHSEIPDGWPASCRASGAHCGWVVTTRADGSGRRPVVRGRDAHWSRDGTTIVYTLPNGGVASVRAAGGRPRVLGRGYLADWSADGSRIVFARLGQTEAGDSIWLMNADGSDRRLVRQGATEPAWQPQ